MPNGLTKLFSRQRNVDSPTFQCPLNKGVVDVEVVSFFPGNRLQDRQPVTGATATLSGGTSQRDPGRSTASGHYRFDPVSPGTYTVTITLTPALIEEMDPTGIAMSLPQAIVGGVTTPYLFEFPGYWIEFQIKDSRNTPLQNVSWKLDHRPPAGAFAFKEAGVTGADGLVHRCRVKQGRYRLSVRSLSNPVWSQTKALVGEPVRMTVDVTGLDTDVTGQIEVLDANDLNTVLFQTSATAPDATHLSAEWKPTRQQLDGLAHSQVVFRATYARATVISAPLTVATKEALQAKVTDGSAFSTRVDFRFTDGSLFTVHLLGGKGDLEIPWRQSVARVDFPAEDGLRVKMGAAVAGAERSVFVPFLADVT